MRGLLTRKTEPAEVPPHIERQQRDRRNKLVEGPRRTWWAKLDVSKLSDDDCEELRDLHRKAVGDGPHAVVDFSALTAKERGRAIELLDKGLPDAERERMFKVEARRAERELENLAVAAITAGVAPRLRAGIQPGEVVLPADAFTLGTLNVADMGLLGLIVHAFSSGDASVFAGGRFSEDGAALLLPKKAELADRNLLLNFNMDGTASRLLQLGRTFEHLAGNDFLDVERSSSGGWTIRLGPRLQGWSQ